MASMKIPKDSPEWGIWGDLWKMLQEFAVPEDTDAYWGKLVQRAHEIDQKYQGNTLAQQGALMICSYLDAKYKEQKRNVRIN